MSKKKEEVVGLPKLSCTICGSTNVHIKAWIDGNTYEYKGETSSDIEDCWCDNCQEHHTLTLKED